MQAEYAEAERRNRRELGALARKLRDTEKRALALLQDSTKQQNLLRHKHQQLADSKRVIRELQARNFLSLLATTWCHRTAAHGTIVT